MGVPIFKHTKMRLCYARVLEPEKDEFSIWDKRKVCYVWVSQYLSIVGYKNFKRLKQRDETFPKEMGTEPVKVIIFFFFFE